MSRLSAHDVCQKQIGNYPKPLFLKEWERVVCPGTLPMEKSNGFQAKLQNNMPGEGGGALPLPRKLKRNAPAHPPHQPPASFQRSGQET